MDIDLPVFPFTQETLPRGFSWVPKTYCGSYNKQTKETSILANDGIYTIIRRIGSGSFGEVFLVNDGEKEVALKLLFSKSLSPDAIAREFRIPKLLSRLTENVVKPDRLIATGDCIGIIMEYCEMSLSEAAKDPANQTEAFIRKVGRQMFRTLDVLQPHGFLHRDIKSDNILLQKRPNGSFVLKFSDFGTSKVGSLVSEHSFAGTPLSMSPEQLTPGKEITSKSDVFSTGITLYLVLKRHYPFSRQDSDDPAVFHVPASMEELTELMRDVSPDLSGLSADCASFFGAVFQLLPEKRPSAADILKMKFFAEESGGGEMEGKGKDEDFVPLSPSLSPLTPSVSLLAQMDALLSHTQILLLELANPSALVCAVCVVVLFEKTAADRRERERRAEEKGGDGETDAGAGREWEEDEGWAGGGGRVGWRRGGRRR
ncbi:putative camk camk1 protein kinase [Blattamonas nauphoetae]|uniref:non-specific serine/threonine protein kinase n=1 Tax=Blattamonas nauphoetae TaxID=2049346 RepID=A0ABQ9XJ38_9EUKA|nr:putative camk camk1 protein kinase [Blattamonas nauphoetae]